MKKQERPNLLTTEQVAERLQVTTRHVQILAQQGKLKKVIISPRVVRYTEDCIQNLIEASKN